MKSTTLPSSSDPPERGREVREDDKSTEEGSEQKGIDSKKGVQTWASKATDKKALKKYDVEVVSKDGKNKVEIPDEIVSDSTPLWEEFVVGKFLDLAPHIAKIHMVVNKIWSYGELNAKVEVYDVDPTTMRFKITNAKAREKVIRRGMWNIAGVPMIVKKWTPKAEEERQEEEAIPMWVHLRKIPLHAFTWEALSFMTSTVGYPVRLHPETMACSNFEEAKVFVKVDVSKKLPKEIDFTMGGKEFTAEFYYPWLPSRCIYCEKWGHNEKVCAKRSREQKEGEKTTKDIAGTSAGNSEKKVEKETDEVSQVVTVESEAREDEVKENEVEVFESASKEVNVTGVNGITDSAKADDEWALVAADKNGRAQTPQRDAGEVLISASKYSALATEDVEDGEIIGDIEEEMEIEEFSDVLEGEELEEVVMGQKSREKTKASQQKGGRRVEKPKAQEVKPKGKRSSRRKL